MRDHTLTSLGCTVEIDFRAALDEDFEFLYQMHRSVMHEYVVDTWGTWDEAWQRHDFAQKYNPAQLQIIQLNEIDVGVLFVQERAEEIYIANLEILPRFQRQGIGTQVIEKIIDSARQKGKPVALRVLKVNRKARSLYQRLGFGVTGEVDHHYVMAFEPANQ